MRRFITIFLTFLLLGMGCVPAPKLAVKLSSPANGSSVISLLPTLVWAGGGYGTTYRLLLAADQNFQNIVMDASNLGEPSYTVPAGRLGSDKWYYWKVVARQGNATSDWSEAWSFHTPAGDPANRGTVRINATLDGVPWSGSLNYSVNGPFSDTDNSVPWNFKDVSTGTYTVVYNYGGPSGAPLASITPSPTQSLTAGGTITFTMNFHSRSTTSINVNATLNGAPWSGSVDYSISGPFNDAESVVPQTLTNLPAGSYTLTYNYGGPVGAFLSSITPSTRQTLSPSGSIVYTLNFSTGSQSTLSVTGYFGGAPWSGPVRYRLSGPINNVYGEVPLVLHNVSPGSYSITYEGGGPAGATLGSIVPGPTITIDPGRTAGFTFNFYAQQPSTGNVIVGATLNGSPWSGPVNYLLSGAWQTPDNAVPRSYNNVPAGTYSLSYLGGGPPGATLVSITPAPSQVLAGGRSIVFNMNFVSQPSTGTITVNAVLDGKPWTVTFGSGSISYTLTGPKTDSSNAIPGTFSNMPPGPYTLNYNSGGPIGATLTGIIPAPSQNLSPGGNITYTLNFTGQPRGSVIVNATLNGQPWSGEISYVVGGPYPESGSSVPRSFANAPAGSYSIQYRAGGPPGATFEGVVPSSQMLPAGGTITFNIMFKFQGLPPQPPPPMPGPLK